jgi:hypothetical protein
VTPTAEETFFIYRWGGPGMGVHDSGIRPVAGMMTNRERHLQFRQRTLADRRFRPGVHTLAPTWPHDYEAEVEQAIRDGKGDVQ